MVYAGNGGNSWAVWDAPEESAPNSLLCGSWVSSTPCGSFHIDWRELGAVQSVCA